MQVNRTKTYRESPRVSFSSCRVSNLLIDQISRKSVSYNKLPQEPIKLTIRKLDDTYFQIYVARSGTVVELKRAVEASFSHLPKSGPGTVSWSHVWGKFCLSYDGEKLLADSDSIRNYGIKDGDQLEFVPHISTSYSVKTRSEREENNLDVPAQCKGIREKQYDCNSDRHRKGKLKYERGDNEEHEESGVTITQNCEFKSCRLLKRWFSYRIFSRSQNWNPTSKLNS